MVYRLQNGPLSGSEIVGTLDSLFSSFTGIWFGVDVFLRWTTSWYIFLNFPLTRTVFPFYYSFHLATRYTDLITFMSFKFFVKLIEGNPVPFAVNYTVGNTLALSSSAFLCGPKRQFKNMFDERRKLVSTVYLSCLFSTLVVVFIPLPWALKLATLIALLITQCGANIWYSLSYIPYGRKTALKFVKKFVGMDDNNSGGFMGLGGTGELA